MFYFWCLQKCGSSSRGNVFKGGRHVYVWFTSQCVVRFTCGRTFCTLHTFSLSKSHKLENKISPISLLAGFSTGSQLDASLLCAAHLCTKARRHLAVLRTSRWLCTCEGWNGRRRAQLISACHLVLGCRDTQRPRVAQIHTNGGHAFSF